MIETTIDHRLLTDLDNEDVEVLFEGVASLRDGKLVYPPAYDVFVSRRLRLLDSELRIREYSDSFKLVNFSSPVLDLYVEALVPAYSTVLGEQSLLYDVLDFLRQTDPATAERWMAAMPDIDWTLKAKRYLRERKHLREVTEAVHHLRLQLYPGFRRSAGQAEGGKRNE